MNTSTYRAIKAILDTDPSLSDSQRGEVLRVCQNPAGSHHAGNSRRPEFISAREAAEILHTSKRTVWRLAKLGKIHRVKIGHRSTRFRLDDLANLSSVEE